MITATRNSRGLANVVRSSAMALRPRLRMRPSEWCERYIKLTSDQTPIPGPYRCGFKPWLAPLLDVLYDNPAKKGLIFVKPSQVGASRAMMNLLLWSVDCEPGPLLYVLEKFEKAEEFAADDFAESLKRVPHLMGLFEQAAENRRELMTHRPFPSGVVDFAGAGTESSVTSRGRRKVFVDEYELCDRAFPSKSGDLFTTAERRGDVWKNVFSLICWGHPGLEESDIDRLYKRVSDRRRWVFDCPGCHRPVEPRSTLVRFGDLSIDPFHGKVIGIDPQSARLHCPHCDRIITDAERSRATRQPKDGGSGRFESELSTADAAKREYVGLRLHRLCDPDLRLAEWAGGFVGAVDPDSRRSFLNKSGEEVSPSRGTLTVQIIDKATELGRPMATSAKLPGGRLGVQFLTTGTDVQAPRDNVSLYVTAWGWASNSTAYLVDARVISGWAAWHEYHRVFGVEVEADGNSPARKLGVSVAAIDNAWETAQVLDNCRLNVYSAVDGRKVDLFPVSYVPHLKPDNPAVTPPMAKMLHPTRPELGPLDRRYLCRHHWVDRAIRLWMDNRVAVLCPLPDEFKSHLMSNVLRPIPKQHGMDRDLMEWVKPDEFRDDWLQSGAYALVGAALKCQLDTIHAVALAPQGHAPAEQRSVGRTWMSRGRGQAFGGIWSR